MAKSFQPTSFEFLNYVINHSSWQMHERHYWKPTVNYSFYMVKYFQTIRTSQRSSDRNVYTFYFTVAENYKSKWRYWFKRTLPFYAYYRTIKRWNSLQGRTVKSRPHHPWAGWRWVAPMINVKGFRSLNKSGGKIDTFSFPFGQVS